MSIQTTKKYKIGNDGRIESLREGPWGLTGTIGGFVESEDNLAQDDGCWVYEDAIVFGKAVVSGNARVLGDARIFDNAVVTANAVVTSNAVVSGDAKVTGDAEGAEC